MEYELTNLTNEKVDLQLLDKVVCKVSKLLNINNSFVSIVLTDNKHILPFLSLYLFFFFILVT